MEYIYRLQSLDEILLVLNDDLYHDIATLNHEMEKGGIIFGNQQFTIVLKKLNRDGYLEYNDIDTIIITWEGSSFIESGGYTKAHKRKSYNDNIVIKNEKIKVRNELLLVNGTWFAGIAAVILLWQVWIWFYPIHANYP